MTDAIPTDDKPEDEGEMEPSEGEEEGDGDEADVATELDWARHDLNRLDRALSFVTEVVPGYGTHYKGYEANWADDKVPGPIDLCRRRALIAAYGFIEREFSPPQGGDDGES